MKSEIKLFTVAGLRLSAVPSAIVGTLVLWMVLSGVGMALLRLPAVEAILGGLIATALHWCSDTFHHWGHAQVARRTGYPMVGLRYWAVFGQSLYPPDEPTLSASVHIKRALGGPIASTALGIVFGLTTLALWPAGGLVRWIAAFAALDNLLILGPGAFVPLGFTDGSTLLHYWGKA